MSNQFPEEPVTFNEGDDAAFEEQRDKFDGVSAEYEFGGGMVKIAHWVRYPSYDFVFATIPEDHPKYEHGERALFEWRDTRKKRPNSRAMYLDKEEVKNMKNGFQHLVDRLEESETETDA